MKKLIFYTIITLFISLPTLIFADNSIIDFSNTCVGSGNPDEIVIHNIEYNDPVSGTVKVWAKFKFNMSTLKFDIIDAGVESTSNTQDTTIKEVTLYTTYEDRDKGMIIFSTGEYTTDWNNFDIGLEPWCSDSPPMCGNYVDTGKTSLSDVTTSDIPTSGLDKSSASNCDYMEMNHVYINKNHDGTYTAFMITSHEVVGKGTNNCGDKATIKYKNLK